MRVVYRGDLDGTVCAAILMDIGLCNDLSQAHPKDMQDGKIEISARDILCNLPYHPDCAMWFDHHSSEIDSADFPKKFRGLVENAPSAARLVYRYFLPDNPELEKYSDLVDETDMYDSAQLDLQQVRLAEGTILLGFLLDPRTGLGHNKDFRISNYQWSIKLPELLTKHTIKEILAMPDTFERMRVYDQMQEKGADFLAENSMLDGNVIVSDLRGKDIIPANRFMIYTLPGFESGNISVRIADGKKGEFATISVGHSIFNRTSTVDAGALCKQYGGGGHVGAATCQPTLAEADKVFKAIVAACQE
ncbi:MAG: exopolyphosphatase [Candidatus Marinimicrobia bacterium]|nr:exopolyphosphatase [Candidatus Neomarinimicrobiota bacterium]